MRARAWGACASVLALVGSANASHAQNVVGEVVVTGAGAGGLALTQPASTGSRLGLTPLETPASIEIVSGDAIRVRGDISLADAIARSTGIVQQNNPGNGSTAAFAARGFSGPGSVMTLYDGMRMFVGAGTVTFPFDPWTVSQVEVLRGPASVLYGQGAIGGAVNVVPKRAGFGARDYEFQAGIGSDRTYRAAVGAGAPVSDQLALRADVSRIASNGYVDRGDFESWAFSGSLAWRPRENLTFTLSEDFGDQQPMRYFGVPLIDGRIDPRTRHLNYNVSDANIRFRDNWAQLRTEWAPAPDVKIRNDLYMLRTKREWRDAESYFSDPEAQTVDRTDYIPIKHNERQVGDTLDASVRSDLGRGASNTLVVGGEWNTIRFTHTNDSFPGTTTTVDAFRFDPGLYIETEPFIPRYRTSTRQYAVFAEDQLKLTPQLSLVGGIRYDHYHVRRLDLVANSFVVDKMLEDTGWRVGAVYQPNPSLSFYAQYARGSDPLGSLITTSVSQAAFDLATGRQVEVGAKGLFMGGRAEWTLAAYHLVKNKLLARVPNAPNLVQQVGQQSSRGIEASLSVQLGGGWAIDANGTVLDARFDSFTDFASGAGVSRNGKTPPNTPESSANAWLSWSFAPQWRVYGGVRYVGRQFGDNADSPDLILPSYTVADVGGEWRFQPNLALTLEVFNAFDRTYGYNAYNPQQWILGRPRAFELRLNGRF